jgi:putative toxin-antitoxin system antitoxin component (TIGR02293 family)
MSDTLTKPGWKKSKEKVVFRRKSGRERITVKKSEGGVVGYCVRGPRGKSAAKVYTPARLIEAVQHGLSIGELSVLQASLNVRKEQLVKMIGISKATLHRRMAGGKLGAPESERVVRFAKLMGRAVQVLESEENARQWLRSPQFGLGGAVPLDYAATEVGAHEVEDLLGRIEDGVYS